MIPSVERNMSIVTEFIFLGFIFPSGMITVFFCLFLLSYLITITGNMLILSLVFSYQRLQKPMYFFLCKLAVLDIFFTSTIMPNYLTSFFLENKTISVTGCLAQNYIYCVVGATQFFLLAVMSFDRYVAICYPLSYPIIMHNTLCVQLIVCAWIASCFIFLPPAIMMMRLSFCFHDLNHFFCDAGPILRNSCTDTTANQFVLFVSSCITLCFTLLVTVISYVKIVQAILSIQSTVGRQRAFSTCSSHAIVVTLFFGSCMFMYLKPSQNQVLDYDKKIAILNTVVVPLINPYIYTLRNQVVKNILRGSTT